MTIQELFKIIEALNDDDLQLVILKALKEQGKRPIQC